MNSELVIKFYKFAIHAIVTLVTHMVNSGLYFNRGAVFILIVQKKIAVAVVQSVSCCKSISGEYYCFLFIGACTGANSEQYSKTIGINGDG